MIQNLEGLENLEFVGSQISISENDELKNVDHLSNLTEMLGTEFFVMRNDELEYIDGLHHMTANNIELYIVGNEVLTSIHGLSSINW